MSNDANMRPISLPADDADVVVVQALTHHDDHVYAAVITERNGQGAERSARLFRAPPSLEMWEELYRRPLPSDYVNVQGQLRRIRFDQGFRNFSVFRRENSAVQSLVCCLVSVSGSCLLESADGSHFAEWPNPSPAPGVPPLTEVAAADSRLFAITAGPPAVQWQAPAGKGATHVFVSRDLASGAWEQIGDPRFGEEGNRSISCLYGDGDQLFVATVNATTGFEVWRTQVSVDDEGYSWQRVVTQGAYRYTLNKAVLSMTMREGVLFLGTAPLAPGLVDAGDNGPELLRLEPDGTWDLVVGAPRFTPDGMKVPLAAYGPGFGNAANAAFSHLMTIGSRLVVCQQFYSEDALADHGGGDYCGPATLAVSEDASDWQFLPLEADYPLGRIQAICPLPDGMLLGGRGTRNQGTHPGPVALAAVNLSSVLQTDR
jgi:hypothetical protein